MPRVPRWCRRRGSTVIATSTCWRRNHRCARPSPPSRGPRRPRRPHPSRNPPPNRPIAALPATPGRRCSPVRLEPLDLLFLPRAVASRVPARRPARPALRDVLPPEISAAVVDRDAVRGARAGGRRLEAPARDAHALTAGRRQRPPPADDRAVRGRMTTLGRRTERSALAWGVCPVGPQSLPLRANDADERRYGAGVTYRRVYLTTATQAGQAGSSFDLRMLTLTSLSSRVFQGRNSSENLQESDELTATCQMIARRTLISLTTHADLPIDCLPSSDGFGVRRPFCGHDSC